MANRISLDTTDPLFAFFVCISITYTANKNVIDVREISRIFPENVLPTPTIPRKGGRENLRSQPCGEGIFIHRGNGNSVQTGWWFQTRKLQLSGGNHQGAKLG